MKLRYQFLVGFLFSAVCALIATDLTYRVVYAWQDNLLLRYQASSPQAGTLVTLFMVLVVPFTWMLLSLLAAAWVLGRRFARPLRELGQAVERLKARDLDFRITYKGRDEVGELCRAFCSMQQELKAALDREWREQEAQREMMAALAHDLRTPLSLIQGHAEGLLAAPPERRAERLERYLAAIAGGSQRATRLLDDLLLIARLEQADFRLEPVPFALEPELAAWAAEYAVLAREQRIGFVYEAACDGVMIEADPARLHQVIDNLVMNALRHTPAGGQVRLALCAGEGVQIEVQDTGPGFAAADLPHLFDRYFQGGQGAVGAAGLGLYICRLLVERHGGRITAGNGAAGGGWVALALPARAIKKAVAHAGNG